MSADNEQEVQKVRWLRSLSPPKRFAQAGRIVQTLNVEEGFLGGRKHWRGFSVRQDPLEGRTAHTKCGLYLLGPSLAVALPDKLFEPPTEVFSSRFRRASCETTRHSYYRSRSRRDEGGSSRTAGSRRRRHIQGPSGSQPLCGCTRGH